MAIDLFKFYKNCLIPLTPHPAVTKILRFVMAGGETTDDFVEVLNLDPELQRWSRLTVQRMGRVARNLDQTVTLLGQDRVRNMIIGRNIERAYIPADQTLLQQVLNSKTGVKSSEGEGEGEGEGEEQESIPEVKDFKNYLTYANKAEQIAISVRNSYPGQAFASGAIFDYVLYFLKSKDLSGLEEKSLIDVDSFVSKLFEDGIRSAMAANAIVKKIIIKHQKIIFSCALLHNIGKALLLSYDPQGFEKAFRSSTGAKKGNAKVESTDAEIAQFDFDHAQAGSLYFSRLSFFEDIEKSIDFHHHPYLLRFTNPSLYALSCALKVSGGLTKLYEAHKNNEPDPTKLPDSSLRNREEFKYLKLSDDEWDEIKTDYANKLQNSGI